MIDDAIRARSRVLAHLVGLVLLLLLFAVAVELAAVIRGRLGADYLALRLPLPFFLWAIWNVRMMILAAGQSGGHDAALGPLLGRVGFALFLGGIASVFGVPLLLRLRHGNGGLAAYDVAAITLGVVGLALILVAHLLGQAAAMRAELDEIV